MIIQKKYWLYNKLDNKKVEELENSLNITKPFAKTLLNRGIESPSQAKKFLNPSIEQLYDPFLLKDMNKVVSRLEKAVKNKEKICIYGDYDVDGIGSISILIKYFESIDYTVDFYIPDRLEEGYGLNKEAIEKIVNNGTRLIITVDCGISSVEEVDLANDLGAEIIITDHHQCPEVLPNAYGIINPLQEGCNYPFNKLCGCGLAFKLIQALTPENIFKQSIYDYLDITAIATIADVVSIRDENRIIVKAGLDYMSESKNPGIQALLKVSGFLNKKLNTGNIAFGIAPRINAAGRIGSAKSGVELLTTRDTNNASQIAGLLNEENKERQQIESDILNQAINIIEKNPKYKDDKVLVVYDKAWHPGVIGIVASRIVDIYYKPTVILGIEDDIAKGSARSIPGFNLFESMNKCKDLFIKFGGHDQAAGLSINVDNLESFAKEMNIIAEAILTEEDFIPKIIYDDMLKTEDIDGQLIEELEQMEPFGIGNPSPKFAIKGLKPIDIRGVGDQGKHLKAKVESNGVNLDSIGFSLGQFKELIEPTDKIDLIFSPEFNIYNGNCNIQLNIKDIKISQSLNYRNHTILKDYYKNFTIEEYKNKSITNVYLKTLTGNKDKILREGIEKASIESPLLILVNTLEQSYKLLSSLEYRNKSKKRKISISFNQSEYISGENEIDLVINPIVDKIQYKRYNNIILYDMFYFPEQLQVFKDENNNIEKTIFLYNNGDEKSNEFVLENIIPTRDQLVVIYKYFKAINSNEIRLEFEDIYINIKKEYKLSINQALLNNALKIFTEGNLLTYKFENHTYSVYMIKNPYKVDLNKLRFTQYLKEREKHFNDFKNTWLSLQ